MSAIWLLENPPQLYLFQNLVGSSSSLLYTVALYIMKEWVPQCSYEYLGDCDFETYREDSREFCNSQACPAQNSTRKSRSPSVPPRRIISWKIPRSYTCSKIWSDPPRHGSQRASAISQIPMSTYLRSVINMGLIPKKISQGHFRRSITYVPRSTG